MRKFENYCKHLEVLKRAPEQDITNEFIISGVIDKFFIQFELGWKVLKELLLFDGVLAGKSGSPREIIKAAYQVYNFIDEKVWLDMLMERNNSAHIYDGNAARLLVNKVIEEYIPTFVTVKEVIYENYGSHFQNVDRKEEKQYDSIRQ